MPDSISFDRAAGYYDRTRAIPDSLMARLIPTLVQALPRDGVCLEIGVGTGRIAIPLIQAGVKLVGVDISQEMLRRMLGNAAGAQPLVLRADATRLPFRDRTFEAALAVHVLHLIPAWKDAIDELMRVVKPGGVLIASRGTRGRLREQGLSTGDGWDQRVTAHFFAQAGGPPWPPGLDSLDELDDHMRAKCPSSDELPELYTDSSASINELLRNMEAGYWAACWSLEEKTRKDAAAKTREWARGELGDLDEPRQVREGSVWRLYRLAE